MQRLSVLLALMCAALTGVSCSSGGKDASAGSSAGRIVSLAPSLTETLFALGCGDRVVGVTDFCSYPPKATELPRVGGYIDPNYEALLRLEPDLVVLLKEHRSVRSFLDQAGIRALPIDNHDLEAILGSFHALAVPCGAEAAAESLTALVRAQIAPADPGRTRPSVLVCIDRAEIGSNTISQVVAAGPGSFYSDLIDAAGGNNAIDTTGNAYPTLSQEGIIRLRPDILIDVMASVADAEPAEVKGDWLHLEALPAVADSMVFSLTGDYVNIPGPRLHMLLGDLRRIVAQWHEMRGASGT